MPQPQNNSTIGGPLQFTPPYRICIVLGTRPEAIKLAPVIRTLRAQPDRFEPVVMTTSQHREMLAQALAAFDLIPDYDLGLTHANQTLAEFTAHAVIALTRSFAELKPEMLLVQGDTSTVVAAVLAAFYQGIPVGHVEAGLRSGDMRRPFPEEANRRIASVATDLHFCPTATARANLLREGLSEHDIFITGNTIVDALMSIAPHRSFDDDALHTVDWDRPVLLATVHRRENLGANLADVCAALKAITTLRPRVQIVIPVHLNPRVREVVFQMLGETSGVFLTQPLSYPDILEVMRRSTLVLTDSGGIQEETPALAKPVLILRTVTERPEVVSSGFGKLVGTSQAEILTQTLNLLDNPDARAAMTSGANPFGDGRASERIAEIIWRRFQSGKPFATAEPRPIAVFDQLAAL